MDEQRSQRSFFVHEQNLELNVRFETYFATATAEFEKSTSKKKLRFSRVSAPRFIELYSLKQTVTRKRAYPIGDCDNLPGPTYL